MCVCGSVCICLCLWFYWNRSQSLPTGPGCSPDVGLLLKWVLSVKRPGGLMVRQPTCPLNPGLTCLPRLLADTALRFHSGDPCSPHSKIFAWFPPFSASYQLFQLLICFLCIWWSDCLCWLHCLLCKPPEGKGSWFYWHMCPVCSINTWWVKMETGMNTRCSLWELTLTVYFFSWKASQPPFCDKTALGSLSAGGVAFFLPLHTPPSSFSWWLASKGDHGGSQRAQAPALMWACPYLLALLKRQVTRTQNCWSTGWQQAQKLIKKSAAVFLRVKPKYLGWAKYFFLI